MGSMVVGYGVLLAALSVVLQQTAPTLAKIAFSAGLVAGGLSVLWGIAGLVGHKRRTWAMLTLMALFFVLLSQVLHGWAAPAGETPGKYAGALLLTCQLLLTVGMLTYLVHGERPPEFYQTGSTPRNHSGAAGDQVPPGRERRRG